MCVHVFVCVVKFVLCHTRFISVTHKHCMTSVSLGHNCRGGGSPTRATHFAIGGPAGTGTMSRGSHLRSSSVRVEKAWERIPACVKSVGKNSCVCKSVGKNSYADHNAGQHDAEPRRRTGRVEQVLASLRTQPSVISGRRRCNVRAGMACHWHDRCRIDRNLRDEEQVLRHSARATSRQCLGSRPQCVFAIGNGGDARDMVRVSGDRVCLVELMDPRLCLTSTAWLTSAAANCKAASLSLHWHGSSYSLLRPGGSEGRIAEDLHRPPAVQRLAII